ncbi:hypothetical protein TNCV_2727791 [Trichonephila clavipes]|nr:hypothetical protein TNCV_2727791 [Trichonephila clavipes]
MDSKGDGYNDPCYTAIMLSPDISKELEKCLPCLIGMYNLLIKIQLRIPDIKFKWSFWKLDPIPSNMKAMESVTYGIWSRIHHITYKQLIQFKLRTIH